MHKLSHTPSLTLVVLACGIAAAQIAHADDASATEPSASTLQEVVVTAQKREERLHDVPMGVSAITQDELQKQQLVSLEDLQAKVPGLSLTQVQPGQTRITLRGQDVGGVGSTVTTYIDDTPFGSSNALANGFGLTGDFDTWDLQRVEVLRGPQGTLYGAGSEGGLLKYVTNPPDPTKLAGALQVGGEDIAHGENAGSAKGMINLPITSSAAFRVSGFYVGEPGYIDDPQLGEKDINHGYRAGLHASLLWEATDNFSVKLNAFGQTLHTDGTPYVDVVGGAGNPTAPPANQLDPLHGDYQQYRYINEPSTNKYRIYSATLNWNLGGAALTSISSYGTTEQDLFIDATQLFGVLPVPLPFPGANPAPPGTTGGSVAERSDLTVKKFTQEFRLASSTAQALEWQVGAFYTHESSSLDENVGAYYIPSQDTGLAGLETVALDALYREWAAFGQVTYHFNPAFDLAVGGRWSENKQSTDESIGGVLIGPPQPSSGESTDTDFTYSVAPRWHISKDAMLYARVASGYRPGGPNALPPTGAPAAVPKSYQSDSTTNYELGSRTTLLDNRLSVDVAAFLVDWKKIQLLEYVDNFGVNTNGGTARSKGIEWTFGLTPVTGLTFTLTGAYVDAYLTSNAPATGASAGDSLPYAPKWSTSLDGAYTWRAFSGFDGFAGATWSYIGSRVNDFAATPTATGGFVPNPQAELPSYNTVNLRAGLEDARWMFELYCKNVGDKRGIAYYTSTNTGTPDAGGVISYTQPRTVGATITARF